MTNVKYVGMDVHKATTVIVVLNAVGRVEMQTVIPTQTDNLRDFFQTQRGRLQVVFEEGTQASWLHGLIKPLVARVVVCDARANRRTGSDNKADFNDAENLARLLRLNEIKSVYKGDDQQQQLKELARTYGNLVSDTTRLQNRLKALYRGRGIDCAGKDLYKPSERESWLEKLIDPAARFRAQSLLSQLEMTKQLRQQAKPQLIRQAEQHPDYQVLRAIPSFGPVRVATLLALVGTPHRFRTKRQFWPYCGLGVRTHSTAEYRVVEGRIVKHQKAIGTRGLNRNHNRQLKEVFKGAATTAVREQTFKPYYEALRAKGLRPEMARLTVARKLAAIVLKLWQSKGQFDPEKVQIRGEGQER